MLNQPMYKSNPKSIESLNCEIEELKEKLSQKIQENIFLSYRVEEYENPEKDLAVSNDGDDKAYCESLLDNYLKIQKFAVICCCQKLRDLMLRFMLMI